MANTTTERKLRRVYDDLERKFEGLVAQNLPSRGRILFVSSTLGSDNNTGDSPFNAFATIGKALSLVQSAEDTAAQFQKDTTIFVLPQHAESIAAASSLSGNTVTGFYMGVPGTKVIGLGEGAQRPTFSFTTSTAADLEVAAADCRIENVILKQEVGDQVTAVTVAAGGDRATFKDIELQITTDTDDVAADEAIVDWFTVAAGANDLTFDGIVANYTNTGTDSIVTAGAVTGMKFLNADLNVTFDSGESGLATAGSIVSTNYGTPDGTTWDYFAVTADGTSGTWQGDDAHEIATVSGMARLAILPVCTTSLGSGGSATLVLGTSGDADAMIGSTGFDAIDAGLLWLGTTPADSFPTGSIIDETVNNVDVGYTVGTAALNAGALVFHVWAKPIGPNSSVGIGAGGAFS